MAQRGYLNYERYRGFTLAPLGQHMAQQIKGRHQILTEFLELVGLSSETVEREVEDIEHHLRPEKLAVFSQLVSFWRAEPAQLKAFKRFASKEADSNGKP